MEKEWTASAARPRLRSALFGTASTRRSFLYYEGNAIAAPWMGQLIDHLSAYGRTVRGRRGLDAKSYVATLKAVDDVVIR